MKSLANDTNGEIHICIDQNHFKQLLFEFNKPSSILIEKHLTQQNVLPPPLILMGFPQESFKVFYFLFLFLYRIQFVYVAIHQSLLIILIFVQFVNHIYVIFQISVIYVILYFLCHLI